MDSAARLKNAVGIVTQAIQADNDQDYPKAFELYHRALEHFMVAIKYDKNPKSKEILMQRIDGYMKRAEELKKVMDKQKAAAQSSGGKQGAPQAAAAAGGEGKVDKEKQGLRNALASAIQSEKPNIKWDDVAGLEGAKSALKEAVILPARFPQLFTGKRRPWKGILLYGPPGTGKSYLAKAVATEANSSFFAVSSSDLVSKWQGESEKLVKTLFEMGREAKPSVIFIDEIDSLCSNRSEGESDSTRRIKTEFLVQMQGVGKTHDGILVLGATNVPWELDPAMRRRFEKRIYIALPETDARSYMAKLHLGDTPHELSEANFNSIGENTPGYSGSDLSTLTREALMEPLRVCQTATHFVLRDNGQFWYPCKPETAGAKKMTLMDVPSSMLRAPNVTFEHFMTVIQRGGGATVAPEELTRFEEWTSEFGQEG